MSNTDTAARPGCARTGAWAAALADAPPCGHSRAQMAVGVDAQGLWSRRCPVCRGLQADRGGVAR